MAPSEANIVIPVRLDQSPQSHGQGRDDIAGGGHVSPSMLSSLTPNGVVVVGFWPVPDQSAPGQLRDQFEDEARANLDAVIEPLEGAEFAVTSELVFTRDRDQLIDRVANKYDSTAVLMPGIVRSNPPDSVLVLLKTDSDVDHIVRTVGTLFGDSGVDILLFHAIEGGDDPDATESMLHSVADRLIDRGIDSDRIHRQQSDRGSRVDTIVSEVSDHDLVVLSESEPTVRERLFGPVQSSITDRTDRPSLTIRANP
ncbi:universal stress protein [Haloarcula montana]|uniref:universal stress protein n=1 Tax=Haloarcula montana TaxID=3111776 RepID=UPI002D771F94|nr:universal stress protein [Haloarcula sp. GH36]